MDEHIMMGIKNIYFVYMLARKIKQAVVIHYYFLK